MTDRPELTREEMDRALTRAQRKRIMAGNLAPGDVAALRRFICLTQEQFASPLGIRESSARTANRRHGLRADATVAWAR